jgi:hypothetical protein
LSINGRRKVRMPAALVSLLQILRNGRELLQRGLEVGGDDFRSREIRALFEGFVFQPEPSRQEASKADCAKRRDAVPNARGA